MSHPNEPYASDWLNHSENLNEIKEEPFDDMADIKNNDLIYYPLNYVKDKTVTIKEESLEDLAGNQQDEPILDAIENDSKEIKEELIDDFVDIKEEELEFSTLPIADVFCPSTGESRPLTIDIEDGMHSRSQIDPPRSTIKKSRKRITKKIRKMKCDYCDGYYKKEAGMGIHVRLRHPDELKRLLTKCSFCDSFYKMGGGMDFHVRWKHPEALNMMLNKCDYCDGFYSVGAGMRNHVRSMHREESKKIIQQQMIKKCEFCDSSFHKGTDMANHMLSMHSQRKCDFCASFQMIGASMNHHVRTIHPKRFFNNRRKRMLKKCDYCDGLYSAGSGMTTHVRSMHREEFKKIIQQQMLKKCEFCDSSFFVGTDMANHVLSKHHQRKCDFCPSFHMIGAQMDQHVRSMHHGRIFGNSLKRFCSSDANLAKSGLSPKVRTISSELEQKLQTYDSSAKCDFCGEETHSYLISPDNIESARRFFNTLELTQTQRASTVRFFRKDLRAIVCEKHLIAEYPIDWNPKRYDGGNTPKNSTRTLHSEEEERYSLLMNQMKN